MGEPMRPRVSMKHERGEKSRAELAVDRGLKSGKLDFIELDEVALLQLAKESLDALWILKTGNP